MKPGVRRLIEDLRGARVLVIHPRDAEGEALIDQLKRIGCNVRGVWPPPPAIPREIDTVFQFVDSSEDAVFPSSSNEHPLTLVAIVDYENPTILKRLLDSNAHGVVNKPIRSFGILSSLVLARSLRHDRAAWAISAAGPHRPWPVTRSTSPPAWRACALSGDATRSARPSWR